MAINQIASINTDDPVLNRIQAAVQRANKSLACPLLNGNLVSASLLASGAVDVPHGLGRVPLGWAVVGLDANAVVWAATPAAKATKVLSLLTSADCNVSLWVF